MPTSLIVTTISSPNAVLKDMACECVKHGWDFIIVGDVSTPADFQIEGAQFLSLNGQLSGNFLTAKLCPQKHYARKNIGYLTAIRSSADIIVETDDDNLPLQDFWSPRNPLQDAAVLTDQDWINIYRFFTDEFIWPRGFPLDYLQKDLPTLKDISTLRRFCPVQQGLADKDPDVDAIYRLAFKLPFYFERRPSIMLGNNSWCPFNSQNTTWFKDAFPLLYLPAYCSFRMTDILRSLVAEKIMMANQWHLLFHSPTVSQERNAHDLMKDFKDEIPVYLSMNAVKTVLEKTGIPSGKDSVSKALLLCYEALVKNDLLDKKELEVLRAWISDLESIG